MSLHDLVALLSAIIGALALVLVASIGAVAPMLISIRRHARSTNDQLTNDHSTNMRVENDERHAEEMKLLRSHGRRLGGIDRRLGKVETRLEIVDERTQPRRRL